MMALMEETSPTPPPSTKITLRQEINFIIGAAVALMVFNLILTLLLTDRKHGGVYTSHSAGRLAARIKDAALVERYRFGTETADFHICRNCGVVPFVTSNIDGAVFAVVNVNSFEGVDPAELESSPTDFDGETLKSRLARRRRAWIPEVTIEAAGV